jgi:hypothetical protein
MVLLLPSLTFSLLSLLPWPVSLLLTVGADVCRLLPSSYLSRLIALLCLARLPSSVLVCRAYSRCLTFIYVSLPVPLVCRPAVVLTAV